MKVLIFGASAGLGRCLAEELAGHGHDLLLIASDLSDLDAMASDIRLRFGVSAQTCASRVSTTGDWLKPVLEGLEAFGTPDILMFPIGASSEEDQGLLGPSQARELVEVNFLAVVATVSAVLPDMLRRSTGLIVGFGSIASARGRRRNVVYAAAKRGLQSYFESLRHLTAGSGVRTQFFQMGYLRTQQSFGRRRLFPAADPRDLAREIVGGLHTREGVFFRPKYWRLVVLVLRLLPWFVFRRLSF